MYLNTFWSLTKRFYSTLPGGKNKVGKASHLLSLSHPYYERQVCKRSGTFSAAFFLVRWEIEYRWNKGDKKWIHRRVNTLQTNLWQDFLLDFISLSFLLGPFDLSGNASWLAWQAGVNRKVLAPRNMLAPVSSCTPFSVDGVPALNSQKYHEM